MHKKRKSYEKSYFENYKINLTQNRSSLKLFYSIISNIQQFLNSKLK